MKRITMLALAVVMLLSLVACGGADGSEDAISVGKNAVSVADRYLDGNMSADDARDKLEDLLERMDYLDDQRAAFQEQLYRLRWHEHHAGIYFPPDIEIRDSVLWTVHRLHLLHGCGMVCITFPGAQKAPEQYAVRHHHRDFHRGILRLILFRRTFRLI